MAGALVCEVFAAAQRVGQRYVAAAVDGQVSVVGARPAIAEDAQAGCAERVVSPVQVQWLTSAGDGQIGDSTTEVAAACIHSVALVRQFGRRNAGRQLKGLDAEGGVGEPSDVPGVADADDRCRVVVARGVRAASRGRYGPWVERGKQQTRLFAHGVGVEVVV